ncbi:MAG: tryptophanase [Candidatus Aminicenantes bacterium]|nr:tryptophanase [Candidatus Aminicenantes bacterium]
MNIRLSTGKEIPVEMHKVRIVQKTSLPPVEERLKAIKEGGYNTFALRTKDIFIDMLTDSGTNAMSDNQLAAMMVSDDAYAGSESFYKLARVIEDVLGFRYVLPTHQGRAAEHLLAKVFIKPGDIIPMNYHFTTTKAHIELVGGQVLEIYADEALKTQSTHPFKGNLDIQKLKDTIKKYGASKIPFVRMEATTNLLGGQPFSIENLKEVKRVCSEYNIPLVVDGSLISENAYFIKIREKEYKNKSIQEIIKEIMSFADLFYLSARKSSCVRGGFIATNNKKFYEEIKPWLPVYEGFLTYGGMSTKEIEAMAVGLREMTDISVAGSAAEQVKYFAERFIEYGIPVVTPPGGLACHVDAMMFLPHIPQSQYPAGALAAAIYIVSGVRSMERGTISMDRDQDGNEVYSDLELARLAVPRRVYTVSHIEYVVDRLHWLYQHRDMVKGLKFIEEPPVLRFFFGKLEPLDNWGSKLGETFKKEIGAQ